MATGLGQIGMDVLGDSPWGSHWCLFYDTKQDLLDSLTQFFKTGLEESEACLWVVSEPVTVEEATAALEKSIPGFNRYLRDGSIELAPHTDWYLRGGRFDLSRLRDGVRQKLATALSQGYSGLRITGDSTWVEDPYRRHLRDYEKQLDAFLTGQPIRVLCTYPLGKSSAAELLEVTQAHQRIGTMRNGELEILESPELTLARDEIKRLNQQLEQKVVDRTRALHAANEELRKEIDERKQVENELRRQKEVLQQIFDHIPAMINFLSPEGCILLVNREWERTLGWSLEEVRAQHLNLVAECYPDPREYRRVLDAIKNPNGEPGEFKTRVRDGKLIDTSWSVVHLSDGTILGIGTDITSRKRAEEQLKATTDRLRALSASIQAAREEERTQVARLIHDELGSALTSLKWDLEGLDKALTGQAASARLESLRTKIANMVKLTDQTVNAVRRIAWELRPSILDDLGLMEAIEWQAQQFEARSGILCRREGSALNTAFDSRQSTAIFRIFQEALTNVLRHAEATRVDLRLAHQGTDFILMVRDNGRGICGIEKSGLGILGMQERARLVGGTIEIDGVEGKGTTITVRVPVAPCKENEANSHC